MKTDVEMKTEEVMRISHIVDDLKRRMGERKSVHYFIYLSRTKVCLSDKGKNTYDRAAMGMSFGFKGSKPIGFYTRNVSDEDLFEDIAFVLACEGIISKPRENDERTTC